MAARGSGSGGLAARYAAALFELAEDRKEIDRVANDLAQLKAMIAGSDELRSLLRSPVLTREDQGRGMAAVLDRAGASDTVRRFVGLVAHNRRLSALSQMIERFLADLAARRGEMRAEVVAARPLNDQQQQALAEAIRRAVGGQVAIDVKIDPGIIGGLVVRVGSRMIDSSLRTKLQRLQLAMKGVG
ncbi:MAG: F0F1 ATP synthase subunit delta [Dongiaceae bacterium]